ncbi:hypothetical protein [Rhodomicrobium sp.]|uniref:hypothetical protein n=1 Tax=Rhodomicrobium sp. TaxID=2720632 RepID=UPI0039E42482
MNSDKLTFLYLDLAKQGGLSTSEPRVLYLEALYSISTLRADLDDNSSIVVYTNVPADYKNIPVQVEDVSAVMAEMMGPHSYLFRAKPWIMLHAIKQFGGTCVFLDTDTFILPGFVRAIRDRIGDGPIVHEISSATAPAYAQRVTKPFPHQDRHTENRTCFECNSGVIGVRSGWGEALIEDTLHIIDEILPTRDWQRTLEQSALADAIGLHGLAAEPIAPWINHYFNRSKKRYMHSQIKRLLRRNGGEIDATRPCIAINPYRVKLYQYFHDTKALFKSYRSYDTRIVE